MRRSIPNKIPPTLHVSFCHQRVDNTYRILSPHPQNHPIPFLHLLHEIILTPKNDSVSLVVLPSMHIIQDRAASTFQLCPVPQNGDFKP